QVWLGPSPYGPGPVGGPAPSSSQRRSTMPPQRGGGVVGGGTVPAPTPAPVPANPQRGRGNVVDLTGEDDGPVAARAPAVAAPSPQFTTLPLPTSSWVLPPAVAAPSSTTSSNATAVAATAAPVNPAPVRAHAPAPGVPAAVA